jgi:hypothetical protein
VSEWLPGAMIEVLWICVGGLKYHCAEALWIFVQRSFCATSELLELL